MKFRLKATVINIAGSAAKTTFTKHGLVPQIEGSVRISIEDWNAGDGVSDVEINAKAFHQLATQLNVDDEQSFVIDIGTSNSRAMLKHFQDLALTRDEIDFWIIPVRTGAKETLDTLKTISMLLDMDVDPKRIVVIAQAITDVETYASDFATLMDAARTTGFCFAPEAVLFNDIYDLLKNTDNTVFDLVRNKPDFVALRREHKGNEKRLLEIGHQMLQYSLALTATKNLQSVFASTPLASFLETGV